MNPTGMLAAAARNYIQNKSQDIPEGTFNTEASLEADLFKKPKRMSELRSDWNKYNDWLQTQQIEELDNQGKPVMDASGKPKMKSVYRDPRLDTDLGMKLFRKYQKENPETTLSEEYFPIIRADIVHENDLAADEFRRNKREHSKETLDLWKKNNFDPETKWREHIINNEISDNPNYPGRYLTQYRYQTLGIGHANKPSEFYNENQYHPDFSIDDYNKATDKSAFLKNVYDNFKSPLVIPGSNNSPYSKYRSTTQLINEGKAKKLSEKNNKTLNQ